MSVNDAVISFNPFQGIQVLSAVYALGQLNNHLTGFNPFQGIQVLSGSSHA